MLEKMALVLTLFCTISLFFGSSAFDLSSLLKTLPRLKVQSLDTFEYNSILISSKYFDHDGSLATLSEMLEFYDFPLSFGNDASKMPLNETECNDTTLEIIAIDDLEKRTTEQCSCSRPGFIKDDCKSFLIYSDYEVCLLEEWVNLECQLNQQPFVFLYENLTQTLYEIQIPMRKAVK